MAVQTELCITSIFMNDKPSSAYKLCVHVKRKRNHSYMNTFWQLFTHGFPDHITDVTSEDVCLKEDRNTRVVL